MTTVKLVVVHRTDSLPESLLVKEMLLSYGFHPILNSATDASLFPISIPGPVPGSGDWYSVSVPAAEAPAVKALLEDFRKGGVPVR